MTDIPILTTIRPLAAHYDAVLCDVWGVVHNGAAAFEPACDALQQMRRSGMTVVLLTNAPRPGAAVAVQLRGLGVPDESYDGIISSGDLTRSLIKEHAAAPMFHLGAERDKPLFDGIDVRLVDPTEAEVVVCSNLFNDETETPDDYRLMLQDFVRRHALMICANPDLKVERGSRLVWCSGALAQLCDQLGGRIIYAGKPHLPVYDLAMARIAELRGARIDKRRVLAIGDGLKTDIEGARRAGIDSVFIASGVHVDAPLSAKVLSALFPSADGAPVAAMPALAW